MKTMKLPRHVVVGSGAIDTLPEVCSELDLKNACTVVTGQKTLEIAGRRVAELLGDAGSVKIYTAKEATFETVEELCRIATGSEFLVAVGGGRVIDVAKLSAKKLGIPFISVPTAPSHDGIASSRASIKGKKPHSVEAEPPIAIIADLKILSEAPPRLIASGFADVVAKLTATQDWELAHTVKGEEISHYSIALSRMAAQMLINNAGDLKKQKGIKLLVKALISCGVAMSIAGSSRPASGSEHKFSHALDSLGSTALHGEQVGIGTILMSYLHGIDWKKVKNSLKKAGAPTKAEEIGTNNEKIIQAMLRAKHIRAERYTILEHLDISPEQAWKVAKATEVVE